MRFLIEEDAFFRALRRMAYPDPAMEKITRWASWAAPFNTREFFHGAAPGRLRAVLRGFVLLAFVLPLALLALARGSEAPGLVIAAFVLQFIGLLAERWFFFAQARHPQNLYYQAVS